MRKKRLEIHRAWYISVLRGVRGYQTVRDNVDEQKDEAIRVGQKANLVESKDSKITLRMKRIKEIGTKR